MDLETSRNCCFDRWLLGIFQLWRPIFKRFAQKMPAQCPLHFGRDHFGPQELAKNEFRADLWMCKICGKPFQSHSHLDLHLAKFHRDSVFQVLPAFFSPLAGKYQVLYFHLFRLTNPFAWVIFVIFFAAMATFRPI